MESLFFLIPVALIFVAIAIRTLFWAVKSGQYDDLDTEAHRILFDDDMSKPKAKSPSAETSGKPQDLAGAKKEADKASDKEANKKASDQ